jgi:hypothetical protein
MRSQPWFPVLVTLAAAGTLQAQPELGVSVAVGPEWTPIPAHVDWLGRARGMWGGSAALELWQTRTPRAALVTRLGYAPERSEPAAPGMITIGAGMRMALASTRHLTLRTSLELEALHFTADAYNDAGPCPGTGGACPMVATGNYSGGWRFGASLRPALEVWPTGAVGLRVTPALRWLSPFGPGGPPAYGSPLYLTVGIGAVLRLKR